MSINHYSSMETTPLWWTQQQIEPIQQPAWFNQDPHPQTNTPSSRFNLNDDEEDENDDDQAVTTTTAQHGTQNDKLEPMFEKPLTPSDVGKLNRLVIPKQHAEKYFPLSGGGGGDSGGECKGMLLSFEDESGKCWRFRYSYWNSSQSYVLTKGWSRYVKDKRLDAGDVVLFQRHRADAQRLFIGWRRRRTSCAAAAQGSRMVGQGKSSSSSTGGGDGNEVGGGGWTRGFYSAHPYPAHHSMPYQHDSLHAAGGSQMQMQRVGNMNMNMSSSPSSSSSSRVLRLFGVNMECQADQHDSGPDCSYNGDTPTQNTDTDHFFHHLHQPNNNNNSPNPHHMLHHHQSYYY